MVGYFVQAVHPNRCLFIYLSFIIVGRTRFYLLRIYYFVFIVIIVGIIIYLLLSFFICFVSYLNSHHRCCNMFVCTCTD